MNRLIIYPHGLGDCILLTPALRQYFDRTGEKLSIVTQERFENTKLFENCKYIDQIYYDKDAWNDFPSFNEGCKYLYKKYSDVFPRVTLIKHSTYGSKIIENCEQLGVKPLTKQCEVYITEDDIDTAWKIYPDNEFIFVHRHTGVKSKDIADEKVTELLKNNTYSIVEPGVTYDEKKYPIGVGFALLARARERYLADSVFFHASCALNININYAYFARGSSVYERVRHLDTATKIETLDLNYKD